jgi:hypothetical protein
LWSWLLSTSVSGGMLRMMRACMANVNLLIVVKSVGIAKMQALAFNTNIVDTVVSLLRLCGLPVAAYARALYGGHSTGMGKLPQNQRWRFRLATLASPAIVCR